MRPVTTENSLLPVPREAFLSVLNHVALMVLVGSIEIAAFDRAINALIDVADGELQAELMQLKLTVKRVLTNVEGRIG